MFRPRRVRLARPGDDGLQRRATTARAAGGRWSRGLATGVLLALACSDGPPAPAGPPAAARSPRTVEDGTGLGALLDAQGRELLTSDPDVHQETDSLPGVVPGTLPEGEVARAMARVHRAVARWARAGDRAPLARAHEGLAQRYDQVAATRPTAGPVGRPAVVLAPWIEAVPEGSAAELARGVEARTRALQQFGVLAQQAVYSADVQRVLVQSLASAAVVAARPAGGLHRRATPHQGARPARPARGDPGPPHRRAPKRTGPPPEPLGRQGTAKRAPRGGSTAARARGAGRNRAQTGETAGEAAEGRVGRVREVGQ